MKTKETGILLISVAFIMLTSCIAATYKAGIRRMAEAKLNGCLQSMSKSQCYTEVEEYCIVKGLEKGCGYGGIDQWIPKSMSLDSQDTDLKKLEDM